MRRSLQLSLGLVLIGLSVASLYNVMADNAEVRATAQTVACEGVEACAPQIVREMKTPIGQSFEVATTAGSRHVGCRRALWFVGGYACQRE